MQFLLILTAPKYHVDVTLQWNLSTVDTTGPRKCVLIRDVSLFQRLICTQSILLGPQKLSWLDLERCPHFRGALSLSACQNISTTLIHTHTHTYMEKKPEKAFQPKRSIEDPKCLHMYRIYIIKATSAHSNYSTHTAL